MPKPALREAEKAIGRGLAGARRIVVGVDPGFASVVVGVDPTFATVQWVGVDLSASKPAPKQPVMEAGRMAKLRNGTVAGPLEPNPQQSPFRWLGSVRGDGVRGQWSWTDAGKSHLDHREDRRDIVETWMP